MIIFIVFVLPIFAVLSLIFAVIWGIRKSKNRKRFFIILGCIVGAIAFLVSSLFIDYRSGVVNALPRKKVPVEFSGYPYLQDTVTADYSIKVLDGYSVEEVFTDSLTGNIIVVIENRSSAPYKYFHRIDPAGRLIGSFARPDHMSQSGRYLIGPDAYCDWIATGDTTRKAYTPIAGVMSREALRPWYNKAADYFTLFSDSIYVLHTGYVWYSGKYGFELSGYENDKEFQEKYDYTYAHTAGRRADARIMSDYESILLFSQCPETVGDGAFVFEYFAKEEYYSGFSSLFAGIGSPTGGNISRASWDGIAYCKLRIGDNYVPFGYFMEYTWDPHEEYRLELSIYTGPNYAILSGRYLTYLISTKW